MNSEDIIRSANAMSPEPLLRSLFGAQVKGRNGHLSIKGVLRADERNGRWVACDWYGSGIGGTINIISHAYGVGFKDSVEMLTGVSLDRSESYIRRPRVRRSGFAPTAHRPQEARPIKLPNFLPSSPERRAYLVSRGLSQNVIGMCEANGSLGYTENAVVFLGRDEAGAIKYAASRYIEMQTDDEGETFNKKDAPGSSKAFCFAIPPAPNMPYDTYLVEGGINALSLYDILAHQNINAFILTTGSVSARKWMENDTYINLIKNSRRCIMVGENETASPDKSAEYKQAVTDKARYSVIRDLQEKVSLPISLTYPPKGYGDVNDYLADLIKAQKEDTDRYIKEFVASLDMREISSEKAESAIEDLEETLRSLAAPSTEPPIRIVSVRVPVRRRPVTLARAGASNPSDDVKVRPVIDRSDKKHAILPQHIAPDTPAPHHVQRHINNRVAPVVGSTKTRPSPSPLR